MKKLVIGLVMLVYVGVYCQTQPQEQSLTELNMDALIERSELAKNLSDYQTVLLAFDSVYVSLDHSDAGLTADHAKINFNKSNLHMRFGKLQLAEQAVLSARSIYDSLNMQMTLDYLDVLRLQGIIYIYQGNKDLALEYFIQATYLAKQVAGPKSPSYAACLMNLGSLYWERQEFDDALAMFDQSQPLMKEIHGEHSLPYGKLLLNKGNLLKDLARYEHGMRVYLQAQSILEDKLGTNHPITLMLYNNMGALLESQGDLENASHYHYKALERRKEALGIEHRDYLQSLGNVAILYGETGLYDKSLRYFDELLDNIKKRDELYSIQHLGLLINQANVYSKIRKFERAIENLLTVINKFEAEKTELHHSFYANALNNLGNAYIKNKEYHKAKLVLEKTLVLRDTLIGRGHPNYLSTAASLTYCYFLLDQYDEALKIAKIAEAASEKINKFDENLNAIYGNLAGIYMKQNELSLAIKYFDRYYNYNKNRFLKSRHFLSDYELTLFVDQYKGILSSCASRAMLYSNIRPEFNGMLYEQVLLYNGFVLDINTERNKRPLDSVGLELKDDLFVLKNKLYKERLKPVDERNLQQIIEEQIVDLEHQLNQRVDGEFNIDQYTNWKLIQSKLAADEVAIEFVRFRQFDHHVALDSFNYLALMINSKSTYPETVYLGAEEELRAIVNNHVNQNIKTATNELYQIAADQGSSKLYQFIWAPLESSLQGVTKVNFVPAGLLHSLNHQTIAIDEHTTMIDRFELVQMGSTRSLIYRDALKSSTIQTAVLFGGLDYDLDTTQIHNLKIAASELDAGDGRLPISNSEFRGMHDELWDYLSATKEEVKAIVAIFESSQVASSVYKNSEGTEERFKEMRSQDVDVIHVATHGYFFDEQTTTKGRRQNGQYVASNEHPMIRSGLILSGANYAWKQGHAYNEQFEDGILTAYEISQLDLTQTELVVLSACESGRGALSRTEGVYGLQRAFKIAGVDKIIMSLWQVPDYHTKELMILFYTNLIEKKMSIRRALHSAQQTMKDEGYEPYYWAGFVLLE